MEETAAVMDASILIDCADLGILEKVFALPLIFKTTDLVWAEVTDLENIKVIQEFIDEGKLKVESLGVQEIEAIDQLSQTHPGLSLEDCSVWYLASQEKAILLTGDRKLRNTAQENGLQVRGSLWILAELVDKELLSRIEACLKIRTLYNINQRLPRTVVLQMISDWCGE